MTVTTNPIVTGVPVAANVTNPRVSTNATVTGVPDVTDGEISNTVQTNPSASGKFELDTLLRSFDAPLQTSLVPSRTIGYPTPTFTRASTAYQTDFEGKQNLVPSGAARMQGARYVRNLLTKTEDLTHANWTNVTATITTGVADPLGGTSAFTLTAAGANSQIYQENLKVGAGFLVSNTTWVRRRTGTGDFKMNNGATLAIIPITSTWQRVQATPVETNTAASYTLMLVTSGDAIDLWHPQGEDVTGQANQNPSEYVSVGVLSAPYHGAGVDGVKYFSTLNGNTVASNVVTESTGAAINSSEAACAGGVTAGVVDASGPLGYLAEGARTNRCLQSQVFSNAAWVSGGGGIAVADNSIAAPDGTTTADTLTASGANGTLIQDLGVVASAAKAGGLWLKRKTGTGNIDITLDGGSTWTTVAVTSAWVRFQKTQTLADEDFGIRIVTGGDAVYAWQGQVETASFLSSDIPTTTTAVTRAADVLTYPSAGNISGTQGSAYAEVNKPSSSASGAAFGGSGGIQSYIGFINFLGSIYYFDGVNNPNDAFGLTAATTHKIATSWGGVTAQMFANGSAGSLKTFDGSFNFTTNFQIGGVNGGTELFGTIRNVRIYPSALSASRMQALTT